MLTNVTKNVKKTALQNVMMQNVLHLKLLVARRVKRKNVAQRKHLKEKLKLLVVRKAMKKLVARKKKIRLKSNLCLTILLKHPQLRMFFFTSYSVIQAKT